MKTAKTLADHFDNLLETIVTQLEKNREDLTDKSFHDLRVAIKKVKALFALTGHASKDFQRKKYLRPFRLIFEQAGKLRELQLEISFLKEHLNKLIRHSFPDELSKQAQKEKKKFFSVAEKQLPRLKKVSAKVLPFLNGIDKDAAAVYIENNKAKVISLLQKDPLLQPDIHDLRKELKKLCYDVKSTGQTGQSGWLKTADTFQQMAGTWHDARVMVKHFKRAAKRMVMSEPEIAALKKIEFKLASDAKNILAEMNGFKSKLATQLLAAGNKL